jgi:sialic acid synthase SpsE
MTKLIAEFCQNHLGDRSILEKMIISAKNNGASHAKIQGLYSHEITKRDQFELPTNRIFRPYANEVERLSKLDLSIDTEKWFVQKCNEISIIPMITVFTHMGVERAKNAGFKSIKFASYDCGSLPIISKVLEFADEIVISTGATYWNEIKSTAEYLQKNRRSNQKIAFLHARTVYPTKLDQFGLLRMSALKVFGFGIGLSDHTKPDDSGLIASQIAIILDADYIERHYTVLDRSETRDGPVSINPSELLALRNFSKLSKADQTKSIDSEILKSTMACSSLEPTEEEIVNREYYRGRVASVIDGKVVYSWENI